MSYANSSKQFWKELEERYNQSNAPYFYQLRRNIVQTYQNGQSVAKYFGRLKSLWEDLSSLDPLPGCECAAFNTCTCNLLKKVVDRDNRSRLLQFLMGLDNVYETVRDQILATDPLPAVNQAFFKVQQVEMQRSIQIQNPLAGDNVAMVAHKTFFNSSSNGYGVDKPRVFGGDKQIHGHNSGFKDFNGSKPAYECDYYGKRGHTRKFCYKLKAYNENRNRFNGGSRGEYKGRMAAHVEEFNECAADFTDDTPFEKENSAIQQQQMSAGGKPAITLEPAVIQAIYDHVMATMQGKSVLDPNKASTSQTPPSINFSVMAYASNAQVRGHFCKEDCWIIDSGASDHMTYDSAQFLKIRSFPLKSLCVLDRDVEASTILVLLITKII